MEKKTSKLVRLIKTGILPNYIIFKLFRKRWQKKLDDIDYENKVNSYLLGYKFDLRHPRTFNEHICYLKYFYHNDLWCKCADKLGGKEFLKEIGLEKYVPKTYGIYGSSKDIDLGKLPEKFVLKTNHDCGSVFICEKGITNFGEIFKKLDNSLKTEYSFRENSHEWVYDNIKPVIFAEEILYPAKGNDLLDYKFFCFNGEPKFGFIGSNRSIDTKINLFDISPFKIMPYSYVYLKSKKKFEEPIYYNQLLQIVKKISSHFYFVRVDCYSTTKGPMIGELTFFPHSSSGKFTPKRLDFEFGKYFSVLIC